jgi:metallo-beta-lactamase family protein
MGTFLTFLGAVGTVTGSRTLVEHSDRTVLVDCGLFQGPREIRRRNWEPFPRDPATLDAIVLTHAHLDHCGYLPALVRDGYGGPVYCTPNTAALAAIVLRDSARLQEEDTSYARRKGYSRHAQPRPLYTAEDAERAIDLFTHVEFHQPFQAAPGITATLSPAGHILGAGLLHVVTPEGDVTFSGDLGRDNHPLLRAPEAPSSAGAVVLEATYGDRRHVDPDEGIEQLADAIRRTIARGGTVLIPAFAVDRTEILLKVLRDLVGQQRIPAVPIHVDSPMALAALDIYREAIAEGDREIRAEIIAAGPDCIVPAHVHAASTPEESMKLDRGGRHIVISASGMGSGGRVVHHLKAMLPRPECTVILAGYQAVGTPGSQLLQGVEQIKMHGRYVPVRAEIVDVGAFSVHADADGLLAWLAAVQPPPHEVFLNHGEPASAAALAGRIRHELGLVAVLPEQGERVRITR